MLDRYTGESEFFHQAVLVKAMVPIHPALGLGAVGGDNLNPQLVAGSPEMAFRFRDSLQKLGISGLAGKHKGVFLSQYRPRRSFSAAKVGPKS